MTQYQVNKRAAYATNFVKNVRDLKCLISAPWVIQTHDSHSNHNRNRELPYDSLSVPSQENCKEENWRRRNLRFSFFHGKFPMKVGTRSLRNGRSECLESRVLAPKLEKPSTAHATACFHRRHVSCARVVLRY